MGFKTNSIGPMIMERVPAWAIYCTLSAIAGDAALNAVRGRGVRMDDRAGLVEYEDKSSFQRIRKLALASLITATLIYNHKPRSFCLFGSLGAYSCLRGGSESLGSLRLFQETLLTVKETVTQSYKNCFNILKATAQNPSRFFEVAYTEFFKTSSSKNVGSLCINSLSSIARAVENLLYNRSGDKGFRVSLIMRRLVPIPAMIIAFKLVHFTHSCFLHAAIESVRFAARQIFTVR